MKSAWFGTKGYEAAHDIPAASELRKPENVLKRLLSRATNWHGRGLRCVAQPINKRCACVYTIPRPDPLALCTLEAQEATAKGVYRLPHAIYRS